MSAPPSGQILDTSAVIGLVERRSRDLVEIVTRLGGPIVRSPTVTGELQHGAAVDGPGAEQRAETLDRYLRLSVWPDAEIELHELARIYGIVSGTSANPELRAGMNDRWVVAECVAFGAGLITADARQARLATAVARDTGFQLSVTVAGVAEAVRHDP